MLWFGRCTACVAKDAHIDDLRAQIQDLRALTIPKNDPQHLSALQIEADAVLSGQDRVIHVENLNGTSPVTDEELSDDQAEMTRILSGTY